MLAAWLHNKVEIHVDGRAWPLIFTHRALLIAEHITGIDILHSTLADPPARLLRSLVYGALVSSGAQYSIEDVGHGISTRLGAITRLVSSAWIASMPDPKKKRDSDEEEEEQGPVRTWMRAWAEATGRGGLGLTSEEWLDMTPRQVAELREIHLQNMQREELMVGIIASTVANFSTHPPKRPLSAKAFMLHELAEPEVSIGDRIRQEMSKFSYRPDNRKYANHQI